MREDLETGCQLQETHNPSRGRTRWIAVINRSGLPRRSARCYPSSVGEALFRYFTLPLCCSFLIVGCSRSLGPGPRAMAAAMDRSKLVKGISDYQRKQDINCSIDIQQFRKIPSERTRLISYKVLDGGSCGPTWYRGYVSENPFDGGAAEVQPWKDCTDG